MDDLNEHNQNDLKYASNYHGPLTPGGPSREEAVDSKSVFTLLSVVNYDADDALFYGSQMATNRCPSPCYKLNTYSPDSPKTFDLHRSGGDRNLQSNFPVTNGHDHNPRSVSKHETNNRESHHQAVILQDSGLPQYKLL